MFGFGKLKRVLIARAATKALKPLKENPVMKNWKTSLAGIATLISVLAKIISNDFKVGGDDIAIVTGAIGLLTAKDHNVTGGTKPQ